MVKSSPFETLHKQLEANFGNYCGWEMPKDYGDSQAEKAGLEEASAAFDLSNFGRLVLKGKDRWAVMQKLAANKISQYPGDAWQWSVICNDSGKIADISRIFEVKETIWIFTTPCGRAKVEELAKTVISSGGFSATIADQTEKTGMVCLYGPKSVSSLDNILPFRVSDIEKGEVNSFSFFMMSIIVIRGSWIGGEGVELICPAGAAKMAGSAIEKYHKREGIVPAGMTALEAAMKERKLMISLGGEETLPELSPIEMGLGEIVDFEKDFVGKQAIEGQSGSSCRELLDLLKG